MNGNPLKVAVTPPETRFPYRREASYSANVRKLIAPPIGSGSAHAPTQSPAQLMADGERAWSWLRNEFAQPARANRLYSIGVRVLSAYLADGHTLEETYWLVDRVVRSVDQASVETVPPSKYHGVTPTALDPSFVADGRRIVNWYEETCGGSKDSTFDLLARLAIVESGKAGLLYTAVNNAELAGLEPGCG